MEATHPKECGVRTFVLQRWVWNKVRPTLQEGYTLFHIDFVFQQDRIDPFCLLSSLTDSAVLEVGYLIKELMEPCQRVRGAIAGAIGRHDSMLVWRYLSRYRMPKLLIDEGRPLILFRIYWWHLVGVTRLWTVALVPWWPC